MLYSCLLCPNEITFKNDAKAEEAGYKIVGFNMAENSRYVRCPDCRKKNEKGFIPEITKQKPVKIKKTETANSKTFEYY